MGLREIGYELLAGKSAGKPLGRIEDNIKMDLREDGVVRMD
jgi:hypothetical protein